MANPTPIYIVTFNGDDLPGYVIKEDIPVGMSFASVKVLNRDGGLLSSHGADFKEVSLTFRVLSRLSNNATGLQHLEDCKNQWRDALAIVARVEGLAALYVGGTDRYVNALFVESTAPLSAPVTRAITYTLKFVGEAWFRGAISSTSKAISGIDTISYAPGASRKTYPVFTIPTGITGITIDHAIGQSFSLSGAHANNWIVDCGELTVLHGVLNGISFLTSGPDFGMSHQGDASTVFGVNVLNVTGSGTVTIDIQLRYER